MNNSSKIQDQSLLGPTIQRCPHDRENPYAQISRALIRDKSLSLKARGLLVLFLSYPQDWIVSIAYFIKEQELGRDSTYSIIEELEKAGYIVKEKYKEKNLNRTRYYVSEEPRFKKIPIISKEIFSATDFQGPENKEPIPCAASIYTKNVYTNIKENIKRKDATPSASLNNFSSEKCKKKFEPEDLEMAKYLSEKVKAYNNKELFNLPKWATDFNLIRRLHGYTQENMKKVIDIAHEHDMWRTVILSPKKLRQHFTAIMALVPKKKDRIKENKNLAEKECHKNNNLEATENYLTVRNWSGQSTAPVLPYQDEEFEDKLRKFTEKYKKP